MNNPLDSVLKFFNSLANDLKIAVGAIALGIILIIVALFL
jgi:hypothetical protein